MEMDGKDNFNYPSMCQQDPDMDICNNTGTESMAQGDNNTQDQQRPRRHRLDEGRLGLPNLEDLDPKPQYHLQLDDPSMLEGRFARMCLNQAPPLDPLMPSHDGNSTPTLVSKGKHVPRLASNRSSTMASPSSAASATTVAHCVKKRRCIASSSSSVATSVRRHRRVAATATSVKRRYRITSGSSSAARVATLLPRGHRVLFPGILYVGMVELEVLPDNLRQVLPDFIRENRTRESLGKNNKGVMYNDVLYASACMRCKIVHQGEHFVQCDCGEDEEVSQCMECKKAGVYCFRAIDGRFLAGLETRIA